MPMAGHVLVVVKEPWFARRPTLLEEELHMQRSVVTY